MAYSSENDLLKEMSESDLAKLTGDTSGQTINSDRVNNAIDNADAMINSYLCGRYSVPFAGTPDAIIKKISVDMTIGNLYESAYGRTTVPSTIVWRRLNSIKLLKDIQSGVVGLSSIGSGTGTPPAIISNKDDKSTIFSDNILDSFYE